MLAKVSKNQKLYLSYLAQLTCFTMLGACTVPSSNGQESSEVRPDNLRIVKVLPPPQNTRNGADQLIAEDDILEVDVFQVNDLDKTVQVDSNGRFSMPLIGSVQAAGKTVPAIEEELERRYGASYLQSPDITIFVKEFAGQKITLDGQFVSPGIYNATSKTTLLQAVAIGRGLTNLADEKKLFIFRDFEEQKLVANFSITDIREGKAGDPRIYGGDIIVAFSSSVKIAGQDLRQALGAAVNVTRIAAPL